MAKEYYHDELGINEETSFPLGLVYLFCFNTM